MTAMPTIQTPEGFLAECRKRGIKLTVKDGTIKASGKPPANLEKFAAFLAARKPELLVLLSGNLAKPGISRELEHVGTEPPHQLAEVGEVSQIAASLRPVLAWALSESHRGLLPEIAEPLALPSGNVVQPGHAAAWLIAAEIRSAGLLRHASKFPDCQLAHEIVINDMNAISLHVAKNAAPQGERP